MSFPVSYQTTIHADDSYEFVVVVNPDELMLNYDEVADGGARTVATITFGNKAEMIAVGQALIEAAQR